MTERDAIKPADPIEATIDTVSGAETEPEHERILADYEYIPFRPDQLITLSQIRGERNVVTNELKEDIMFQGLQNPVDVSFVTYELLMEYIEFTNRVWNSKAKIEDYLHLRLPDGRFPLLKSGHSRHEAITELIAEERLPANQRIMTRVSKAETVQDIVDWQRGENISSQPPRERTAMALVESYTHGIEIGAWHTPAEFIAIQQAKGRDATRGALDQALKYAQLPPRIRNFVLAGQVPYLAGVEMGATTEILTEFVARSNKYGGIDDPRLSEKDKQRLREIVIVKLDIMCNRIAADKLNSTAAQRHIQGNRNEWTRLVKAMRGGKRVDTDELGYEWGQDQLDLELARVQRELKGELINLKRKYSGSDVRLFLRLQTGIIPEKDVRELIADYDASTEETKAKISADLASRATAASLNESQELLI